MNKFLIIFLVGFISCTANRSRKELSNGLPKDLDEAINYFEIKWTTRDKEEFIKDSLKNVHFSVGMWIRNNWIHGKRDTLLVQYFHKIGNGNPTSNSNNFDHKILGNGCPKSFMGMTHDFEYKNFNLSVLMTGAFGFKVKDLTLATNFWDNNYNKGSLVGDIRNFKNNWIPYTDVIIKNGNYVKIENITLGYTIPLYNQIIKSAKVYIGCNNVALFTGFKGGYPETAGINGLDPGVYYGERYYNSLLFIFRLKVTL